MASPASLCFALLILAAPDAPPATGAGAGGVPIRAHVFELEGVQWRGDLLVGLRSVGRNGSTSIWTADETTLRRLTAASTRRLPPAIPKGRAGAAGPQTNYVATLDRLANGSVGQATAIAFAPKVETITDGVEVDLSGRRVAGGVLADVAIEDTRLVAVHTARYHESVRGMAVADPLSSAMYHLSGGHLGSSRSNAITGTFQVPEVIKGTAAGRWLVPAREALVVGLGVHTVWDADRGCAVLRERVVVLDAGDVPASVFERPPGARQPRSTSRLAATLAVGCLAGLLGMGLVAVWSFRRLALRSRATVSRPVS